MKISTRFASWSSASPKTRLEMSIPPRRSGFSAYLSASSCRPLTRIYERIIVRGPEFVGARLTPEAYSLGLALAMPERVQPAPEWVLARPTGVGRAISTCTIPIEGRDEWLAAARLGA